MRAIMDRLSYSEELMMKELTEQLKLTTVQTREIVQWYMSLQAKKLEGTYEEGKDEIDEYYTTPGGEVLSPQEDIQTYDRDQYLQSSEIKRTYTVKKTSHAYVVVDSRNPREESGYKDGRTRPSRAISAPNPTYTSYIPREDGRRGNHDSDSTDPSIRLYKQYDGNAIRPRGYAPDAVAGPRGYTADPVAGPRGYTADPPRAAKPYSTSSGRRLSNPPPLPTSPDPRTPGKRRTRRRGFSDPRTPPEGPRRRNRGYTDGAAYQGAAVNEPSAPSRPPRARGYSADPQQLPKPRLPYSPTAVRGYRKGSGGGGSEKYSSESGKSDANREALLDDGRERRRRRDSNSEIFLLSAASSNGSDGVDKVASWLGKCLSTTCGLAAGTPTSSSKKET